MKQTAGRLRKRNLDSFPRLQEPSKLQEVGPLWGAVPRIARIPGAKMSAAEKLGGQKIEAWVNTASSGRSDGQEQRHRPARAHCRSGSEGGLNFDEPKVFWLPAGKMVLCLTSCPSCSLLRPKTTAPTMGAWSRTLVHMMVPTAAARRRPQQMESPSARRFGTTPVSPTPSGQKRRAAHRTEATGFHRSPRCPSVTSHPA